MGGSKPPSPNPGKDLKESTKVYLKFLPQILQAEQQFRTQYDPQRIQQQQALQQQYGPTQYAQQIEGLQRLDPGTFGAVGTQGQGLRGQLQQSLSQNLGTQYSLPPALQQAVTSQARAAEVARGNVLGNAPAAAEDIFAGNAMNQYYQQNVANTQRFLMGPSIGQSLLGVQPVAADRASAYVNPAAPGQAAQNSYQNALAAYQLQQGSGSGQFWGQAIGGTLGGVLGGVYGGPAGSQLGVGTGSAVGSAVGGYFSDAKVKHHIVYVGRSPSGLPIYEFCYENCNDRWRGTIAQELLTHRPDAVHLGADNLYRVDYSKIDIPLERIPNLVEA